MAVHEQKIAKFLDLYNTEIPSNSRLGLCSPDVEHNYRESMCSDVFQH